MRAERLEAAGERLHRILARLAPGVREERMRDGRRGREGQREIEGEGEGQGETHLPIDVGYLPSEDNSLHTAHDPPPGEWSPAGSGVGGASRDGPLLVQVHVHVSVGLLSETKYLERVCMQSEDNVLQIERQG